MPADGGEAVQVTRQPGGDTAFESSDGRSVVFANDRVGVWKKTVDGEEELVLPEVGVAYRLAVTDEGIYFIKDVGNGATIEFFSFATRRVTRIATMDKPPGLGLAVSPDGRWLLYTQTDVESQGLMLADNFR
jgi:Tol biopolymer transport system component